MAQFTDEEVTALRAAIKIFGGPAQLVAAADAGMDYLLGYAIEQAEQDHLEALVAALGTSATEAIPAHEHVDGTSGPVRRG